MLAPTDVGAQGQGYAINNRPDLLNPALALFANPVDVTGGKLLLNSAAFAPAAPSALGNTGRNAFTDPASTTSTWLWAVRSKFPVSANQLGCACAPTPSIC
ncbi:MAG: hypothetical protein WDO18_19085 [Acidobacteriota bacterium]